MNRTVVLAIARRDLLAVRRNPGVLAPMIIVPVLLMVVLPLATYELSRSNLELGNFGRLLEVLPGEFLAGLPGTDALRLAVAAATYVVPPLLLVVPLMVASVMATDSVAGERERGTIEGLLLTPAADSEILAGKLLGAAAPAMLVGLATQVIYAAVVNALLWSQVGHLMLPNTAWFVTAFWFGPGFTALALGLTVVVSARARSVQAASQISGILVLPLVGMTVGQMAGVILLLWWVALIIGALFWVGAVALVMAGAKVLQRERQVTSLA